MSVIPRQEVPGRWLPFNAAIIVTIVWIDNRAHYGEMGGKGRKLEGYSFEAADGWAGGRGARGSGGMCAGRSGAWESLFVRRVCI